MPVFASQKIAHIHHGLGHDQDGESSCPFYLKNICRFLHSQAPVLPTKRRTVGSSSSSKASRPSAFAAELFPTTKADKRRIKHSSFLSRIEKPKKSQAKKIRRPSKKLVTTLESLADALPDADAEFETSNARIKQRSLKSSPGAMKKKAKLEAGEKERFQQNLAQLAKGGTEGPENGTSAKWAALRAHINATIDRNEAT